MCREYTSSTPPAPPPHEKKSSTSSMGGEKGARGGRDNNAALLYSLRADQRDNQIKQISNKKKRGSNKEVLQLQCKKDEKFKLNTKNIAPNKKEKKKTRNACN